MKKHQKSFTENKKSAAKRLKPGFEEKSSKPTFKKIKDDNKKNDSIDDEKLKAKKNISSANNKEIKDPKKELKFYEKNKKAPFVKQSREERDLVDETIYPKKPRTKFIKKDTSSSTTSSKNYSNKSSKNAYKKDVPQKTNRNSSEKKHEPKNSKPEFGKKKFTKNDTLKIKVDKPYYEGNNRKAPPLKELIEDKNFTANKKVVFSKHKTPVEPFQKPEVAKEEMRLNRYLAHAGIAARRKADMIIQKGDVLVNNKVVKEMGYRVMPTDVVKYKGKVIEPTRNFVYILLNKPKDYITTLSDEKDRKTVMQLVEKSTDQRIYPVGRLDRNTTGLLLLTNDGTLTQKLSHPSFEVRKIYHATLNKPLEDAHFEALKKGVELEDGFAKVNDIGYPDPYDRAQIGVEIHIGKNRIVRRLFEHLGYTVEKLDRVMYAGLTKKDLPRGKHRILKPMEVMQLKKVGGN
jgi:23S rRNA pseudouridine2605 synthase